ncbi:MAG: YbbR-like domain-containing protein [Candidatus Eisenbacteria bacterium]
MSTGRRAFWDNTGIKVAAILLSLLVYFHVKTEGEGEVSFRIPVELTGLPDTLTWAGEVPKSAVVTMEGRLKHLLKLKLVPLRIPVDLSEAGPGRFQRSLSVADVPVPDGFNVSIVRFGAVGPIDIVIERKLSRAVPVVPVFTGRPAQGFVLDGQGGVSPDFVVISGPESLVASLDTLFTLAVDVSEKRQPFTARAGLDTRGVAVTTAPDVVEVFVAVQPESSSVESGEEGSRSN